MRPENPLWPPIPSHKPLSTQPPPVGTHRMRNCFFFSFFSDYLPCFNITWHRSILLDRSQQFCSRYDTSLIRMFLSPSKSSCDVECHIPICAIQFNFRWLISSCGGAISYYMVCNHCVSLLNLSFCLGLSRLNFLVEDLGTSYSVLMLCLPRTQNTSCLGKASRHLADETRTDVLHCRFA